MAQTSMGMTRMQSFPFTSKQDGWDADGYPVYDRAVGASMFRTALGKIFTNGVFGTPADALQIGKGTTGLTVTVQPGIAIINGAMGGVDGEDPLTLTLDTASPQGNVCYAIMLRYDNTDERRSLYFNVVRGDASSTPQPPTPDTTTPEVYEIRLGYVKVPSNATDLSEATVVNEKGTDDCPYAMPFEEVDLSQIVADAQATASEGLESFNEFLSDNRQFVQDAIDGTTAGNLQNQIDELKNNSFSPENVDNSTLEFSPTSTSQGENVLRVKDAGITAEKMADGSVGTSALASSSITTEKYADGSVTYAKLADDVEQAILKPKVGKDIAAYSWDELIQLARDEDTASQIGYLVGQSRPIAMSGYGTVDFMLIGINHDTMTDGGTAAMTFMAVPSVAEKRMNATSTADGGWGASEMMTWLNSTLYATMPDYMDEHIVAVDKLYRNGPDGKVVTVSNKLWLLSVSELTGSTAYGSEGQVYEYWSANNNKTARIKLDFAGDAVTWWLRSVYNASGFWRIDADGGLLNNSAAVVYGVVPCFCIG